MHAIVNAKTPRVVVFVNSTNGTLTIPKHCHAGYIKENTESGCFASSWNNAMKAVTIAIAVTAGFSPAAAQPETTSAISNARTTSGACFATAGLATTAPTTAPTVATEFHLTPAIQAIAEGYSLTQSKKAHHTPIPQPSTTLTETPLTDTVFNLIQASREPFANDHAANVTLNAAAANHDPMAVEFPDVPVTVEDPYTTDRRRLPQTSGHEHNPEALYTRHEDV
jgi:hypothetical protein